MKKLFYLTLLLFGFEFGIDAQVSCNCTENLQMMIQKTELNYAGFPSKVSGEKGRGYQKLKTSLLSKSTHETNPKACFSILRQYVRFFKDKHFSFSFREKSANDSVVLPIPKTFAKKSDLWEGTWINEDSTTKIVIVNTAPNVYKALKLESKDGYPKGFVYFTLLKKNQQWYAQLFDTFMSNDIPVSNKGNLLYIWNFNIWARIAPQKASSEEIKELSTWRNHQQGVHFESLNKDFFYIRIPSFGNNDGFIQSLVAQHHQAIISHPYLIIDLRGNGGGESGWVHLLPYLMTNPIRQEKSQLRVSPENVMHKRNDLSGYVTQELPKEYLKYFPDTIMQAYRQAYEELPKTTEKFYSIPSVQFPLDSVSKYPQKVAVLFDELCGSSTEYFFYLLKQSSKVVTYGQHTVGMMDYEGMSNRTELPYQNYYLYIPISQSSWTVKHPIDETGFHPQVILRSPKQYWIEAVIKDLPRR
ncbi:MAG: S41 family peptidase [Flectobacillus sp.]|uniref:S41 family peptidase n=1 Tax=Flectobacillus sp. TaxID=50419 RepID=UPI003B99C870